MKTFLLSDLTKFLKQVKASKKTNIVITDDNGQLWVVGELGYDDTVDPPVIILRISKE